MNMNANGNNIKHPLGQRMPANPLGNRMPPHPLARQMAPARVAPAPMPVDGGSGIPAMTRSVAAGRPVSMSQLGKGLAK